jgi:SAM-dependent methyltransferase
MTLLRDSWSAFPRDVARIYLDGYGHPSERSKLLMATLLAEIFGTKPFRLADFGCGNAHLYAFFTGRGLHCEYYGYDFSSSLIAAARERYAGDPRVHLQESDIEDAAVAREPCDVVLFSHVLEALASPQRSLVAARRTAPLIMVRFFEPPDGEDDIAEVRQLDTGREAAAPYLRRTMSRDYYNLLLFKIGCTSVDAHQVEGDKDQVHVLRFAR